MIEIKTHKELLESYGVKNLRKDIKEEYQTVYRWYVRGKIPGRAWAKVAYHARKAGYDITVKGLEKMYGDKV